MKLLALGCDPGIDTYKEIERWHYHASVQLQIEESTPEQKLSPELTILN